MPEKFANYIASTLVTATYTSGDGHIDVTSTAGNFPTAATFTIEVVSPLGTIRGVLRVSAIASGTRFTTTPEGADFNAVIGDSVNAVLSAAGIAQLRTDMLGSGLAGSLPSTTGQTAGNTYYATDTKELYTFNGITSAWEKVVPFPVSLFSKTSYAPAARVVGTVYQNTSGFPMLVFWRALTGASSVTTKAITDAANPPTLETCGAIMPSSAFGVTMVFIVQNNHYYKVTGSGTLTTDVVQEFVMTGVGTFAASGDLSGSKALTTVYQNTSGGARLVIVVGNAATTSTFIGTSDSASSPTNVVWSQTATAAGRCFCVMLVPNNWYYKVTSSGSPTLAAWNEYDLGVACTRSADLFVAPASRGITPIAAGQSPMIYRNISRKDLILFANFSSSGGGTSYGGAHSSMVTPNSAAAGNQYFHTNTTAGAVRSAMLLAQAGDFYAAGNDTGTVTAGNCWEYSLG